MRAGWREDPARWLDLETSSSSRECQGSAARLITRPSSRAPLTTLDDHLARGLRVEALRRARRGRSRRATSDDDAVLDGADVAFGPPILRPPPLRDFYAFEGHVGRCGSDAAARCPETWYRLPIFYFSNVSEIRGPDEPVWSPAASSELDYELEVAALDRHRRPSTCPRSAPRRRSAATRSSTTGRPATSSARRRRRPARAGQGQGLRELVRTVAGHARRAGRCARPAQPGYDRRDDRRRSTAPRPVARPLVRRAVLVRRDARAGVGRRPPAARATCVGSGTVGTGCLLEVRDATLGRYLEPGDEGRPVTERRGPGRSWHGLPGLPARLGRRRVVGVPAVPTGSSRASGAIKGVSREQRPPARRAVPRLRRPGSASDAAATGHLTAPLPRSAPLPSSITEVRVLLERPAPPPSTASRWPPRWPSSAEATE